MSSRPLLLALAVALAPAPLGAQEPPAATAPAQALDSSASHAATTTAAEVQHGTATPEEHEAALEAACGAHDPKDIITPHITDSHCIELPGLKFWEPPNEYALPRWAPIHVGGVAI